MTENKKVVYLSGGTHRYAESAKAVWEKINSLAKPGQRLGLETDLQNIKEFERIRQLQELNPETSFNEEIKEYLVNEWKGVYERARATQGASKRRTPTLDLYVDATIRAVCPNYEFFYELYKRAINAGLVVVPLETKYGVLKMQIAQTAIRLNETAHIREKRQKFERLYAFEDLDGLVTIPVRERQIVKRIVREKVDFPVLGNLHFEEVESQLKEQGIETQRIYYIEPPKNLHPLDPLHSPDSIRRRYRHRREIRREIRGKWSIGKISGKKMKETLGITNIKIKPAGLMHRTWNAITQRIKKWIRPR